MAMKDKLKSIGAIAGGLLICLVALGIIGLLIDGAGWVTDRLFPWFVRASGLALVLLIVVFLPLSVFRASRAFAAVAILCVSYVLGGTLWMQGFLTTLHIWGSGAVLIGICLLGVGVVPIAILATLFHGLWTQLAELVVLFILTFGSRVFSRWLDHNAHASRETRYAADGQADAGDSAFVREMEHTSSTPDHQTLVPRKTAEYGKAKFQALPAPIAPIPREENMSRSPERNIPIDMLERGRYHRQSNFRNLADWENKMVNEFGPTAIPLLKSIWDSISSF
jgi:hypothetical protein